MSSPEQAPQTMFRSTFMMFINEGMENAKTNADANQVKARIALGGVANMLDSVERGQIEVVPPLATDEITGMRNAITEIDATIHSIPTAQGTRLAVIR
jgi:hypothetical protein